MTTIANVATAILQEGGYTIDATSVSVTAAMVKAENGYPAATSNVAVTAQIVLDENNYTVTDISLVNLEKLIDNAINYINLNANTTITALAGDAGSKTVNVDRLEAPVVKNLAALLIRAYKDRGPQAGLGGLTVTSVTSDPQYQLFTDEIKAGISRLQTLSATNVEVLIDNAIGYVNSVTGLQMALMTGDAGSKTAALTGSQAFVVKLIAGILLKVNLSRGSVGSVDVSNVTKDPEHSVLGELITTSIQGLKTLSATYIENIVNDTIRYINSKAGTSIAALTGDAGSKSLVGTDAQVVAVKLLATSTLKEMLGQRVTPFRRQMIDESISSLMGCSFSRA